MLRNTKHTLLLIFPIHPTLLTLWIVCAYFSGFAQNEKQDSLSALIAKDKKDSLKVIHLCRLADTYVLKENFKEGLITGKEALKLSQELNYTNGIESANNSIWGAYTKAGNYTEALVYYFGELKASESRKEKSKTSQALRRIAFIYKRQGDYKTALNYFLQGVKTDKALEDKKAMADKLNEIGILSYLLADYPKALDYFFKALEINTAINNKKEIAKNLVNVGIIYNNQANYPKALDYYFKALKTNEALNDKTGMANNLGNIGVLYSDQGDNQKALAYYFKALKLADGQDPIILSNIGLAYINQSKHFLALTYLFKALKISEQLNSKSTMALAFSNIGDIYYSQGSTDAEKNIRASEDKLSKAADYYLKALKIYEELEDKEGIEVQYGCLGKLFVAKQQYIPAHQYLFRALALADSVGRKNDASSFYESLSELYEKANVALPDSLVGKLLNPEQMRLRSLYYYKRYISIKDSLFSQDNKKELVKKEMNFEFEKKEAATKAEHEKQIGIAEAENKHQQTLIWLVAFVALAIGIITLIILRALRITNRQKTQIEQQKKEIELVHKKVSDSIKYAEKIQRSILPSDDEIKKYFPNYFRYFKPKDVISGDFYWFYHYNGFSYIAVADCTGHGVPGALMSMTVYSLLNEIMMEEKIINPGEILSHLHRLVYKTLQQHKGDEYSQDGCDISLCVIDHADNVLHFSGAHNNAYLSNGKDIRVLKAASKAIGGLSVLGVAEPERTFGSERIELTEELMLVMSTDGVFDQLNDKDEVFGSTRFKKLINEIYNLPVDKKNQHVSSSVENWKAYTNQQDDMLVMGLKLRINKNG